MSQRSLHNTLLTGGEDLKVLILILLVIVAVAASLFLSLAFILPAVSSIVIKLLTI